MLSANRGVWADASALAHGSLDAAKAQLAEDSSPLRWQRGPALELPVVDALKDLGVAQGVGRAGKELQADRAKVAFARLAWVARLGLPKVKLALLAGASALAAGMFGAAAHVYDGDFLPAARRWVMHAVHRGSRFAQVRLHVHLVLPTKAADPHRIALRKGWACCSLARRLWGEELFSRIWALTARDGPLLSFKKLLAEHGIEHSFMAGGPEWSAKHSAHKRLDAALEQTDLAWVGRRRQGFTDAANIDVKATRALADRMEAGGFREAYQSATVGDVVVRDITKHWHHHDGACLCGLAAETVQHVWWQCPRCQGDRLGTGRCGAAEANRMSGSQARLGVQMRHSGLEQWRQCQRESLWQKPAWSADVIFVDGSGLRPTDPATRVVGWAMCGRSGGGWSSACGSLLPGETVWAAEGTATARAIPCCNPGGTVVTVCLGMQRMWRRFRALGSSAIKAVAKAKHRCWEILGDATRLRPDVRVRWMPSHKTPDELSDLGVPRHWHAGNAEADERAKAAARQQDVPEELLQQYRVHAQQAERVANTVAAIQLRRLRARPRTAEGAAIKERLRQAPGLPRRLRARGQKRSFKRADEPAQVGQAALAAGELLHVKPGAWPTAEAVRSAVQADAAPEDGLHDLRPPGPWPSNGSCKAINGRLPGLWACWACGRKAGDSSRAAALARQPCGAAQWQVEPAEHDLQPQGAGMRCTRCLLQVAPHHAQQLGRSRCPVPRLLRGGQRWPEGEHSLRAILGRIRGYRRWWGLARGGGGCPGPLWRRDRPAAARFFRCCSTWWRRTARRSRLACWRAGLSPGGGSERLVAAAGPRGPGSQEGEDEPGPR